MEENELLIGTISFQLTIAAPGNGHTFNATLENSQDEFRIHLLEDERTPFREISRLFGYVSHEVSFFTFGKVLKAEKASINGKGIKLDLSKARLITMKTTVSSDSHDTYFVISTYEYSYEASNLSCKASSYLNHPSLAVIKDLDLVEYGINGKEDEPKLCHIKINDFDYEIIPNMAAKPYTAIVGYDCLDLTEAEIEKRMTDFLGLLSFYYGAPIEEKLTVIRRNEDIRIIHKQPLYKLQQRSYENMDLLYSERFLHLTGNSFSGFVTAITKDSSSVKGFHTLVKDYLRAKFLDSTSTFVVLYSIIETLANSTKEYFEDGKNMRTVFMNLYDDFLKKIRLSKEESKEEYLEDPSRPGSVKINSLKKKWILLANSLSERPALIHPVKELFKEHGIDWEELNECIKTKNIKDIIGLRNKIVHDRITDYTLSLDMNRLNSDLSFAICMILLNKLGITDISFDERFIK